MSFHSPHSLHETQRLLWPPLRSKSHCINSSWNWNSHHLIHTLITQSLDYTLITKVTSFNSFFQPEPFKIKSPIICRNGRRVNFPTLNLAQSLTTEGLTLNSLTGSCWAARMVKEATGHPCKRNHSNICFQRIKTFFRFPYSYIPHSPPGPEGVALVLLGG